MIVVIIIAVLVIGYIAYKFSQSATPKGFATQLAITQLKSYRYFKAMEEYSNYDDEEMFELVLSKRPKYTEDDISQIIKTTKQICRETDSTYDFRELVLWFAIYDYERRMGPRADGVFETIMNAVYAVIPENISGTKKRKSKRA